ncbi:conserved hypothetical protein [Capnocytophaga canis]|uniref:DUF7832 domain-containing protein n=1 Tax=Capnocytophaga canis TaxID=1848903 RepID=A0A0B7I601_9FLAO|nr:hypothetical protein [Capnocytophaga canis]CEN45338.1 conserved hypothetical protein [Capnocytophaga canis]CEN49365.1 conserved hypothetical protein [Capnocytophaga canis]
MKYDDASWHYEGEFPANLPNENGATHIGMFLAWCIENDLISDWLREEAEEEIQQVKEGKLSGADFLISVCDEKLLDEDLSEIGNAFAQDYYKDDTDFGEKFASYTDDYINTLDREELESFYEIENTPENYQLLKKVIDKRFQDWKKYKKM